MTEIENTTSRMEEYYMNNVQIRATTIDANVLIVTGKQIGRAHV